MDKIQIFILLPHQLLTTICNGTLNSPALISPSCVFYLQDKLKPSPPSPRAFPAHSASSPTGDGSPFRSTSRRTIQRRTVGSWTLEKLELRTTSCLSVRQKAPRLRRPGRTGTSAPSVGRVTSVHMNWDDMKPFTLRWSPSIVTSVRRDTKQRWL